MGNEIRKEMSKFTIEDLGIAGETAEADPYHFKGNLTRCTIEDSEHFRVVIFFLKKGVQMPLHDHPNMSVYFKLLFGELDYYSYDKVENKYRYNEFESHQEYEKILNDNTVIDAKKSSLKVIRPGAFMLLKPSLGNMHSFVTKKDSAFFDVMVPNYSDLDIGRRMTYFKEIDPTAEERVVELEYDFQTSTKPDWFVVDEVSYRGAMAE